MLRATVTFRNSWPATAGLAALAASFARMAGYSVRYVRKRGRGKLPVAKSYVLFVNGHPCSVVRLFPVTPDNQPYLSARIRSIPKGLTLVAFVDDENCYVLPVSRVLVGKAMYVPVGERASRRKPLISFEEWEGYRQAWPEGDD